MILSLPREGSGDSRYSSQLPEAPDFAWSPSEKLEASREGRVRAGTVGLWWGGAVRELTLGPLGSSTFSD